MSNKYWVDKTDGVDAILAENFNSAFAGIESDIAQKANKFVETEISNINEKLEQKADKTSVDAALEQKADKAYVDAAIGSALEEDY